MSGAGLPRRGAGIQRTQTVPPPIDRNRSQHHQMYSDSKWGAKESYDLCINTSRRYVKDLVPAIAKFCEDWFNSPE